MGPQSGWPWTITLRSRASPASSRTKCERARGAGDSGFAPTPHPPAAAPPARGLPSGDPVIRTG
eukprot:10161738-Alexandrium_andersonii.AAC.1